MEKLEYALSYKNNKGDKGNAVRIAAAQALGKIGDERAIKPLIEGTSWRAVDSLTADKAIEMIRQRAK
jgi:HEAT repeat protein